MTSRILAQIRRRARGANPVGSDSNPLSEGEILAERYRVLRLVDRGGFGQVYLAKDLELGGRVALKTLRPRFADSPEAIERFKREVFLARRVTHDNVCRLFDLGRHTSPDADHESLHFVTMEFLDGETLRDRVRNRGRLDLTECLDLAKQIAHGLRAAHRQGVIHRDIKGSNVLLVEQPDGTSRAVITDFGLALGDPDTLADGSEASSPAVEGPSVKATALEGTPLFMAPEQVLGEAVTSSADLYSLGVLLYHMVTGAWPFGGTTAVSTALARLDQDPLPPSRRVPGLDPRLEAIILRCLARKPSDRFASIDRLLDALQDVGAPGRSAPQPRRQGWRRWAMPGVLAGVVLSLAVVGGLARPRGTSLPRPTPGARSEMRPSLAVVPFVARGNEPLPEGLGTALAEGLAASLAAGGKLRLVNVDAREELRAEWRQAAAGASGPAAGLIEPIDSAWTLEGVLERLDAGPDPRLTLDLRLVGSGRPPAVHSLPIAGTLHQHRELIEQAAAAVRRALELAPPTADQVESARAELPRQTEAALLYAQGLVHLRSFDAVAARRQLEAALAVEPNHPLVLSALADALSHLGYRPRSAELAEQAFRHSGDLSRDQQLAVEARYRLARHEWERAEELFRALHEFFPDDLDIGLQLASAQSRNAQLDAAFATLERLRRLPPPSGADPRIDLAEARVAYHSGDYPRSQAAAERAASAARTSGLRLLLARALDHEALTRVSTDSDSVRVDALLQEALALYREVHHKRGQTEVLFTLGQQARQRSELDQATAFYRQGLEVAAETGNLAAEARGKTALGILHDLRGQLGEGLALKKRVLDNYRERNIRQGEAITLENIGISLFKMGRPVEALEYLLQASERFTQLGDQIGVAWAPYHAGRVWLDLGDLESARSSLERARRAAIDHPEGGLAESTELELARLAAAEGEGATAEKRTEALIVDFEGQSQPHQAAEARLLLAQVLTGRGRYSRVTELAREVLSFSDREGIDATAAEAQTLLTRAALAEDGARRGSPASGQACHQLANRVSGLEHRRIALQAQVVLARCSLLRGRPPTEVATDVRRITSEAAALRLAEPLREATCLEGELLSLIGTTDHAGALAGSCVGIPGQGSATLGDR